MLRSIVPFQLFVFILLLLPPSIGRLAPLANVFDAAFAINPSSLTFEKMLITTVPQMKGALLVQQGTHLLQKVYSSFMAVSLQWPHHEKISELQLSQAMAVLQQKQVCMIP
jgi:hypothetical protein